MSNFTLIVCLFICTFSFSQENCSITYKGIVLDKHDNKPVPFAKIQIKGKNSGVIADSNGYFHFSSLCEGVYSFSCLHHVGCEPHKFDKEFKKAVSTTYFDTIYIEFHFQELDETNIVHTVFEISSISVVKPSELEKKMALGKTLGELLKQIPGVSTLNTGNSISKPVIHGMHSNRIVSMNNEIRQEGQQWGSEHAPEIDPFLCTDVSLIKGANAIRFGSDAIAGVIQVSPEKLTLSKGIRGKMQTTAFSNGKSGSTSGILEGGFSKLNKKEDKHIFSWRIQGTAKQGGTMKTPSYFLKNTAMKEYNFSWNTVYTFKKWQTELFYSQFNTDLGIFSGAHIGNLTDLQNAFQAKEPLEKGEFTYEINRPKQHIEHELFKVKNQYVFNDKHKINLIYGRQFNLRQEFDNHLSYDDSLAALNLPAFQFTLTTHTLDLKYEHAFFKNTTGEIGLSSIYQKNTWQGRFFIPNFLKKSLGAYLLEVLKWKNNELEFGLRADYANLNIYIYEMEKIQNYKHEFQKVSSALGFSKKFGHHLLFRTNFSSAWRTPSVNELYSNGLHHGAAAIEVGNRNLKMEESYAIQSGLSYKSLKFNAELDVYHNQIQGFIYLKPTLEPQLTIKGAFPEFEFEQINARFSGLDFYFSYKIIEKVEFSLKSSIVRAFNLTSREFLVGIPADRFEPSISFKKEFKKGNKFVFQVSIPIIRTQDRIDVNSDYVAPPKGCFLLNTQCIYSFQIKKQTVDVCLEVSNLTNTVYRDYLNRFRYFSDEIGRNIGFKLIIPINY